MNIVENVALRTNAVCAVFSLEMTRDELVERMIYTLSGVSGTKTRKGKLTSDDWKKLWNAQKLIEKSEIMIDDTAMTTVPMILSKCRRLKSMKGRLDLVVVDHMQLMNAVKNSENRQAEITEISRGLKMVAKELGVPVIALSQLRRLPNGQKPALSDLRESGSIEQDADVVLFIHRPNFASSEDVTDDNGVEIKKDECLLILAKNRSGPLCNFKLAFNGELSKFVNIAPENYGEPYQPKQAKVIDDADVPMEEDDYSPPDDGSLDEVFDD
jgi:replicative DNA helicase